MIQIIQVDAFTNRAFAGNPAAVCIIKTFENEKWMQAVANEMNLSETAFLLKTGDNHYRLRWFTPQAEIKLCGHATLASAHALYQEGHISPTQNIHFHTLSGELIVSKKDSWLTMNFPVKVPTSCEAPEYLLEALGVSEKKVKYVGKNEFDYLIEVENAALLRQLQPNFSLLSKLPVRGVIVSSRSDEAPYDFVSRFFAPAVGVPEDPVTGSAHCCLCPFWAEQLGKKSLIGYQASQRGGIVKVTLQGERVLLTGQAVTVMKAELLQSWN